MQEHAAAIGSLLAAELCGLGVLGERIRSTIENFEFSYKDEPIFVRVSIGIAVADDNVAADYEAMRHLAARAVPALAALEERPWRRSRSYSEADA